MNSGQKLWERALKALPGGNGLLSKRPERYAPNIWPTYFSSAKGVHVQDLDNNSYIDMAQMGLGSAILGYSNEELDDVIKSVVDSGVNCTLNAPEEVFLAEKLLELNPFGKGVRFARGGGEAMAIAIRMARAASGRSRVVFSGYHGWMDWYLAANIGNSESLDEHLLPGLEPVGIPNELAGTAIPCRYNDYEMLEDILGRYDDIGVICIEGARFDFAEKSFLKSIERFRKERDLIVIFDEITSGLRLTGTGVYSLYNFDPDIAVYGKALGGGYAISAVVCGERVTHGAENIFLSSTMWTERVGLAAGLKTLEMLHKNKSWVDLDERGRTIEAGWKKCAEQSGLKITTSDFKPLITMSLQYGELNDKIKTLFTSLMLDRGYLAATSVYLSSAHDNSIIEEYIHNVGQVFTICADAIDSKTVDDRMGGSVRSDSFTRLT